MVVGKFRIDGCVLVENISFEIRDIPGRNVNQKLAVFQLTFMATNEHCLYFVIMYQFEIDYDIYTSHMCI